MRIADVAAALSRTWLCSADVFLFLGGHCSIESTGRGDRLGEVCLVVDNMYAMLALSSLTLHIREKQHDGVIFRP